MNILPPSSFFSELLNETQGSQERQAFIRKLPRLEEKDVAPDDTCAICQETFLAIIATEEMASVMETPGLPEEDMGVIKLPECGHRFCRKDIATWVYSSHSTCPACRNEFLPESIRQPVESDVPEAVSLAEARELIRVLQLRASGIHDDADGVHHNPFNEGGGVGVSDGATQPVDDDEREYLRRMQDELMRSMFSGLQRPEQDRDEPPRESFGMYS